MLKSRRVDRLSKPAPPRGHWNSIAAKNSGDNNGQDQAMAAMHSRFDSAYNKMISLPTLSARRKASIALAPMLDEIHCTLRAHGRNIGVGAELADYRADHLLFLYQRGFEAPCQWTENEVREAMSMAE
jgi:hypothetical protein